MNQREIKLAKGVKIEKSIFDSPPRNIKKDGLALGGRLNFEVPKDCNLIILCGNKGGGYVPYRCSLPHQVYLDDIKEAFEKKHFKVIYIFPVQSKTSFPIVFKDDYEKQRNE